MRKMKTVLLFWLAFFVMMSSAQSAENPTGNAALIQQGKYLATAADCIACHSAPQGKPFAGGLSIATPLGAIVATNITPSKNNGIGNYTLAQFTAALREGKRVDGANLYPAMPYTAYAKITDADMAALYAYFMHGVEPVDSTPAATALPFPFNLRSSLAAWNAIHLDKKTFVPDASKSAEINRGAYLGQALAHCSTCHTPRDSTMGEITARSLGGSSLGTWYAPNITPDTNSGIGNWSVEDIAAYLKTGRAGSKAQAAGPMAEAVDHSLRYLNYADIHALAVWLKQTAPVHDAADSKPADAWGTPANYSGAIRGVALPSDRNQMTGPQIYDAYCASCHQASGKGTPDGALPPLFHNTALGRNNSDNVVMAILEGVRSQSIEPGETMPAFHQLLSDQQITTLSNYLTQQFGHPEAKMTVQRVGELRAGGASSPLLNFARMGIIAAVLFVLLMTFLWMRRRRR